MQLSSTRSMYCQPVLPIHTFNSAIFCRASLFTKHTEYSNIYSPICAGKQAMRERYQHPRPIPLVIASPTAPLQLPSLPRTCTYLHPRFYPRHNLNYSLGPFSSKYPPRFFRSHIDQVLRYTLNSPTTYLISVTEDGM
jgi:hypothetical protein